MDADTYYYASFLEKDAVYHSTTWPRLKRILKTGHLASTREELNPVGADPLLPGVVCFTTSKWRHLSDLPTFSLISGVITNTCYLKIPFETVAKKIRPVLYKLTCAEVENFIREGENHLTQRFDMNLARLAKTVKIPQKKINYYLNTIFCEENEWRILTERFVLPPTTEVYVCNKYQLKLAKQLTQFPTFVDHDIAEIVVAANKRGTVKNRITHIFGNDKITKSINHIKILTSPVRRQNGSFVNVRAVLCGVPSKNADEIVHRANTAGLTVLVREKPLPKSSVDIEVDLKPVHPIIGATA